MPPNPIAYLEPLGAAYQRMKAALFQPFDPGTWLVLGFASFIAGWGTAGSIGYRSRFPWGGDSDRTIDEICEKAQELWADPLATIGLMAAVLIVFALVLLVVWITSRGEFVFLDSVIHGHHAIVEPWRAGRVSGNSLFLWRLVVGLIFIAAFALLSTLIFFLAWGGRIPRSFGDVPWVMTIIGFVIAWLPFAFAAILLHLVLRHFVTPIMYRDRCTTNEAWRRLEPVLREHVGAFIIYALFVLVIHIGLFLALIPLICVTCCVLGCLLAIPVVGAILWLPVSYTLRGLGPEFLRQFGPEYSVWPEPAAPTEAAPA